MNTTAPQYLQIKATILHIDLAQQPTQWAQLIADTKTQHPDCQQMLIEPKNTDAFQINQIPLLLELLGQHDITPIGLQTTDPHIQEACQGLVMPFFDPENITTSQNSPDQNFQIIEQPITPGSTLQLKHNSIILADISAGTSVICQGNLQIYSQCKGHIFCASQQQNAFIYFRSLNAQTIGIGPYKIHTQHLPKKALGKSCLIYTKGSKMHIKTLT